MMIETNSPEETYAFGKKLGMEAQAGQVYCLSVRSCLWMQTFTKQQS